MTSSSSLQHYDHRFIEFKSETIFLKQPNTSLGNHNSINSPDKITRENIEHPNQFKELISTVTRCKYWI